MRIQNQSMKTLVLYLLIYVVASAFKTLAWNKQNLSNYTQKTIETQVLQSIFDQGKNQSNFADITFKTQKAIYFFLSDGTKLNFTYAFQITFILEEFYAAQRYNSQLPSSYQYFEFPNVQTRIKKYIPQREGNNQTAVNREVFLMKKAKNFSIIFQKQKRLTIKTRQVIIDVQVQKQRGLRLPSQNQILFSFDGIGLAMIIFSLERYQQKYQFLFCTISILIRYLLESFQMAIKNEFSELQDSIILMLLLIVWSLFTFIVALRKKRNHEFFSKVEIIMMIVVIYEQSTATLILLAIQMIFSEMKKNKISFFKRLEFFIEELFLIWSLYYFQSLQLRYMQAAKDYYPLLNLQVIPLTFIDWIILFIAPILSLVGFSNNETLAWIKTIQVAKVLEKIGILKQVKLTKAQQCKQYGPLSDELQS